MVDQEILKRIERGRQIGFDDTKIKKLLLSKGHNPQKIEETFAHSYKKSKKELKKIKATAKEGPFLIVFSIAFVIFIIFLIYFRDTITQRLQSSAYSILFYSLFGLLFLDIILIGIHFVKKSSEKRKIIKELGIEPVKKPKTESKKSTFFTSFTSFLKKTKKEPKEKTIKETKKIEKVKELTPKKESNRLLQIFSIIFFISLVVIVIASFYKSWITFALALILMFLSLLFYSLKKPKDLPEEKLRKQLEKQEEKVAKNVENLLKKENKLKFKEDSLKQQIEEMVRQTSLLEEKEDSLRKKGVIIPTAHKEAFAKIKKEPEPIITPAAKSKGYETDFDMLVNVVNQRGRIKLSEAAQTFKVSLKHIEEWGRILEEHDLLKVHYPAFGEAELVKKHETNNRKV